MQHLRFQNTKLFSYEDSQTSSLPTKEEYFALESHRQLISPRPVWMSVFFRLLMVAVLSSGVPPHLVVIWAVVSFSANHWLVQLIENYRQLVVNKPRLISESMKQAAKQFKFVYQINCVIWVIRW